MQTNVILVNQDRAVLDRIAELIEWPSFGCRIMGRFTNPLDALNRLDEIRPDIAFIDIYYKGTMDGFALAKRLCAAFPDAALVLLTGGRDFDAARKCLRKGFNDYILVDECTPEAMETVLNSIRINLHHSKRKNAAYKRQLLREVIKGKKADPHDIANIFGIKRSCDYAFLLIRRDRPFLLDPLLYKSEYYEINWHGTAIPPDCTYIGAAFQEPGMWGLLLAMRDVVSARRYWEASYAAAVAYQRSFFEQQNDTVSVAISELIRDPNTLPETYDIMRSLIRNTVFTGNESIFFAWDASPRRRMSEDELAEHIEEIRRCMYSFDFEGQALALSALFAGFISPVYNEESLRRACIALDGMVGKYARDMVLSTESDNENPSLPNNCKDILRYYEGCIRDVMTEAGRASESRYCPKIKQVVKYINQNYAKDISLKEMGGRFNMSGDYLRHLFKKQTGQRLRDYITAIRIEKAMQLLLDERYRVVDVASMTGFHTPQYFSQVFKKATGSSPTEYANMKNSVNV